MSCALAARDTLPAQKGAQTAAVTVRVARATVFYTLEPVSSRLIQVDPDDIKLLAYYQDGEGYRFNLMGHDEHARWARIKKGSDEYFVRARDVLDTLADLQGGPFAGFQALENTYACPIVSVGQGGRLEPTGESLDSGTRVSVRLDAASSFAQKGAFSWVSRHCASYVRPLDVAFSTPNDAAHAGNLSDVVPSLPNFGAFRQMAMDHWAQNHNTWSAENQRCYCAAHMVGCADPNGSSGDLSVSDAVPVSAGIVEGCTVDACNQACQTAKRQLWDNYNQSYAEHTLPDVGCDPQHGVEFQVLPMGSVSESERGDLASGTILGKNQPWTDNGSLWAK
ncbi:MAG: hypothetical protein H6715_04365 [Myxococcales bacterium]|nr:hypothetical protein [Myxococcales bacterium]